MKTILELHEDDQAEAHQRDGRPYARRIWRIPAHDPDRSHEPWTYQFEFKVVDEAPPKRGMTEEEWCDAFAVGVITFFASAVAFLLLGVWRVLRE